MKSLSYYIEKIDNEPEKARNFFREMIANGELDNFKKLLKHYYKDIEPESFRFLYPLVLFILDYQNDNYKPYIDAIYEANLELDVSKTKHTLVCNDLLSLLYEKNASYIVDYLIDEKNYPVTFLNQSNFYDHCCLTKNAQAIDMLYYRGFKLSDNHYLYKDIMPEHIPNMFTIFDIITQSSPDFKRDRAHEKLFFARKKEDFSIQDYQTILDNSGIDLSQQHIFDWLVFETPLMSPFYKDKALLDFLEKNKFPLKTYFEMQINNEQILQSITTHLLSPQHKGILDYFCENQISVDISNNIQISKLSQFFNDHIERPKQNNEQFLKIIGIFGFSSFQSQTELETKLFNKNIYLGEESIRKFWLIMEQSTLKKALTPSFSQRSNPRL